MDPYKVEADLPHDATSPRLRWLARLIAANARADDSCPRALLRLAYAKAAPDIDQQTIRKAGVNPTADAGQGKFDTQRRRAAQRLQSEMRGRSWHGSGRRPGEAKGRRSSDRLGDDLRVLEKQGVVQRIDGETVKVLDWVEILKLVRN